MAQQPHLDDRYVDGVWYDRHTGDFVEIERMDETIGLRVPGENEPFYTFDEDGYTKEEAINRINRDYEEVMEIAVENPEAVVTEGLDTLARNDTHELNVGYSLKEAIALRYAINQVEITS
jgi:hypothetical protein